MSAGWFADPNVTPASRQYAFIHVGDDAYAGALRNWGLIGLATFGAPVSIDGVPSSYGGTRQLTTSAAPNPEATGAGGSPEHGSTVVDRATPLLPDGTPRFAPVWYMAFPD